MPFVCPSVTLIVPSHIPQRITDGTRPTRKEWLRKQARIRRRLPPKRWMKIAKRCSTGKVKALRASRLLEARETRANPATDAVQKILKMEMVSPIRPRAVVGKAIFPTEKANQVAISREIPRESMLAKAREPPKARKADKGKDHVVSGTLILVVVHQCTKFLVPTKITTTTRRWRAKMPQMMKGIRAQKVWESSGTTRTVLGKACIRLTREMIRSRGAKVVWPPHTQSAAFLNVRSWTLERCL